MKNFVCNLLGIKLLTAREMVDNARSIEAEQEPVESPVPEEESGPKAVGFVRFVLLNDGSADVTIDWIDGHPNTGTVFGEFLHRINSGQFKQHCGELVCSAIQKNVRNKPFVEACIGTWNKFLKEEKDKEETPFVNPLSVFGMTKGINSHNE